MTWTKLSDTFTEELEEHGAEVLALHVAALCYCNRLLTDGHIPKHKAATLFPLDDPAAAIAALIKSGRWIETATGYMIARFLDDQRSADAVRQERETTRRRLTNWRAARASNGVTNGVSNGVGNGLPVPSRKTGARAPAHAREAAELFCAICNKSQTACRKLAAMTDDHHPFTPAGQARRPTYS
jgi:hypothetical protein